MAMSILPKFLTLKWNISRTIWRIEVGDGSFFFSFFTLFHLSLTFFRPEVPFKQNINLDVDLFASTSISMSDINIRFFIADSSPFFMKRAFIK